MGIISGGLHRHGTDALVLSVCVLQLTRHVVPLTVNLCTVCGCVHLADTSKGLLDTILDFLIICHCGQLRMVKP